MGHFAAGSSSRSRYERSSARRGTTLLVLPLDVRIISHRSHHLASPTQQGAPSCTVSPLYDLARRGVAAPTQQGHPRAQPPYPRCPCQQPTTLWKTPVAVPLRKGVGVDLMTQRWSDASCRSFFRRSPPAERRRRWAVAPSVRVRAARSAADGRWHHP